jgi:hypothetical protein
MILRYYGRDESTAWAEPSRLSRRLALMSPHGLQRLLIDGGVSAAVLRGEIADLITAIDSGRPAILLVRTDPLMWHYVVVIGYRGGAFLLADPYGRLAWVDETALDLSWSFDGVLEGRPVGRGLDRQPPDPIRRGLERLGLTPHLMILPDRPPDPSDTPRPPPARSNSLHVPLSDEPMDPPKPGLGSGPSLGTTIQPALL